MMNNPYYATADWSAISIAWGMVIGLVVTVLAACLLPRVFPRLQQVNAFFWVMLGILCVTSFSVILILTPHQVHGYRQALK